MDGHFADGTATCGEVTDDANDLQTMQAKIMKSTVAVTKRENKSHCIQCGVVLYFTCTQFYAVRELTCFVKTLLMFRKVGKNVSTRTKTYRKILRSSVQFNSPYVRLTVETLPPRVWYLIILYAKRTAQFCEEITSA